MPENQLFENIKAVRAELCDQPELGGLVAEKYLISGGDFTGYWFCFENADLKWRFDSPVAEVWRDGQELGELTLSAMTTSETDHQDDRSAATKEPVPGEIAETLPFGPVNSPSIGKAA